MRKYVLSFVFLMMAATVMGQKKSIVNLIQSEYTTRGNINGRDVIKVYKGTFKQDYSLLSSDSAYFYAQDNAFDAFGNVNINQGDTLNIFSDKLKYNGNTHIAILTDNVKMVDKDATLTTNYLTYNTATRIGTYTDGGKLVNHDNTLTSKNGYYFANSRDSYFRYNVVLVTVDALIKTDTLRYNTGTRISYFYGPTNIYGTKDKDTLYTENGLYNTITEQAFFGKKNFYKQGTKSLKGDSLFYDKIRGFGKAIKNVTFNDNEQKTTIKGDLGTYFRAEEKTIITENAYVVMVTEDKDTSKADTVKKDSVIKITPGKKKSVKENAGNQITSLANVAEGIKPGITKNIPANAIAVKEPFALNKKDSTLADSAVKTLSGRLKNNKDVPSMPDLAMLAGIPGDAKPVSNSKKHGKPEPVKPPPPVVKPAARVKRDSIFMTADTIETQIMTYRNLKLYQQQQRLLSQRDTSVKARKLTIDKVSTKFLVAVRPSFPKDTSYLHRDIFKKDRTVSDSIQRKKDKQAAIKRARQDSIARVEMQRDPVFQIRTTEPKDTARERILIAHHHAKIFKSDLQAKADSIFYSNSDSTIRCYVKPIIWTEGSQLSGDTVNLQMKNKKLDNIELYPSAFIVNIEKNDSLHFNQMEGKKMRGFFVDNKMRRMYAVGNAESIFFQRDSDKVSGMQRSLSSRIIIDYRDGKISGITFATKPENHYTPINKVKEDDKILKGFLWKPKERPVSKESIIPSRSKKNPGAKSSVKDTPAKPGAGNLLKGGLKADSLQAPGTNALRDSTLKADTTGHPVLHAAPDTTAKKDTTRQHLIKAAKHTGVNKPAAVKKN